jgi:DNA invertase Pin-like site-specific DNA recombinase
MSTEEEDLPIEEKEEKKGKRLTPAEWQEICNLFEMGMMKANDLAAKFGVSRSALHQHFSKNGIKWNVRKEEMEKKVEEKVITFAMKRKQRIEETKTQSYELDAAANAYGRKMLSEAIKSGVPLATKEKELKALHKLTVINALTRQGRYAVLDAAREIDEAELPEIRFRDLSKEEIEARRKADQEDELDADLLELDDEIEEEGF